MKKSRKGYKKIMMMSAAALGMTALLSLEGASAYFTTYVSAGGSQVVHMGAQTEIHETVREMTKHIQLSNTSDTGDCFVRVRVLYSGNTPVTMSGGEGWSEGADGYWYYNRVLAPGENTSELLASIEVPDTFKEDDFNVVVIQECTPAVYDDDGNLTADWSTTYTTDQGEEAED